jgi:hypothetical protein
VIPPALLARLLARAEADWEWIPGGLPFPTEQEHAQACEPLGLRSSDPETWSPKYRLSLQVDLQRRRNVREPKPSHSKGEEA